VKRETLEHLIAELDSLQRDLDAAPHGIAKRIIVTANDIRDLVLGEEFDGQEIMYNCESCDTLLLSDDEIHSDETGDCHVCAKCFEEAKAAGMTVDTPEQPS
jgi:hypothetical protein